MLREREMIKINKTFSFRVYDTKASINVTENSFLYIVTLVLNYEEISRRHEILRKKVTKSFNVGNSFNKYVLDTFNY